MDDINDLLQAKLEYGVRRRPEYGPIWLHLPSRSLQMAGTDRYENLTDGEYQILWLLVRAQGRCISSEEILEFMSHNWPEDKDVPISNGVSVLIGRLREKMLRLTQNKINIQTSKGFGYYLGL